VVERRRERVDVGCNGESAGLTKRPDDVNALARAREENRRHAVQYSRNGRLASTEAPKTAAAAIRQRRGKRSTA
jgi:hypothetical protein